MRLVSCVAAMWFLLPLSPMAQEVTGANAPRFDRARFGALEFLVGRWQGTGSGGLSSAGAFFEEYSWLDDSTIVQRTFANASFTTPTDSARLSWRGGVVAWLQSGGNPLHALELSESRAVFGQQSGAPVTLQRESADQWRVLIPSGPGGQPSSYTLRRVPRP